VEVEVEVEKEQTNKESGEVDHLVSTVFLGELGKREFRLEGGAPAISNLRYAGGAGSARSAGGAGSVGGCRRCRRCGVCNR
jgi:hypothetical protein